MSEIINIMLPGNPRYQPKALQDFFGYDVLYRGVAEIEIATLQTLGEIGVIPREEIALLTADLIMKIRQILTSQVDKVEREITKHDIRAWVRLAQESLPASLQRWVHVPLTSYDPLDSGRIWQYLQAYQKVLKPSINEVISKFVKLIKFNAGAVQIGRTHGQHALPITVGFWMATILYRIIYNAKKMDEFASQLVGKVSGAVGAHNAQVGLKFSDRCGDKSFEERVLEKVGLKPAPISTQILPPESLDYFLFSCAMLSASFGQFGRDCRNLMRTEIGEIQEAFESGQVGSSTMAHKRNPINFENLEGMWIKTKNELGKVLDTLISEHQRDLVGSCVARDFPIIIVNLTQQLNTLLRKNAAGVPFIERITVNSKACRRNFKMSSGVILAEPLYIALQMAGYEGDAHEVVNRLAVPLAIKESVPLILAIGKIAEGDEELQKALSQMPAELVELLGKPESYTGDAITKAMDVVRLAEEFIE